MRMTPLDVQSHRFSRKWAGVDPHEVDSFLRLVAEDYEALLRENESLRDETKHLQARVTELGRDERLLKETLIQAQAMGEDLRRGAVKESEVLLSEAEVRAEKIVDAAHRRAARLAENIRELRSLRSRLAETLRAGMQAHMSLIDALEGESELETASNAKVSRAPAERVAEPAPGS